MMMWSKIPQTDTSIIKLLPLWQSLVFTLAFMSTMQCETIKAKPNPLGLPRWVMFTGSSKHSTRINKRWRITALFSILIVLLWYSLRAGNLDQNYSLKFIASLSGCSPGFGSTNLNIPCQAAKAQQKFDLMQSSQSKTKSQAVREYRRRYRRSPPRLFEQWVEFALYHNSSIIDEYDAINEDLAIFREMGSQELQRRIDLYIHHRGRDKAVTIESGKLIEPELLPGRFTFLEDIAGLLPNLVLPINAKDEPGMVPKENDIYNRPNQINFQFVSRSPRAWDVLYGPCLYKGISSPTRSYLSRFRGHQNGWLEDEKNICRHPEFHYQHGNLFSPNMFDLTETLFPYVGISTLSTTADIRAPPYLYYWKKWRSAEKGDEISFVSKKNQLYWRGAPSGTFPTEDNYRMGHRQRLVILAKNLLNDTERSAFARLSGKGANEIPIPSDQVNIAISSYLWCNGDARELCKIQQATIGASGLDKSSTSFEYQYVFDLDGNGVSGRFYRLLESNSAVFKQTLYYEWHDERLIPWLHYIPISMSMKELPAVLDFFTTTNEGQEIGHKIADASRKWASKTLRNIDMTIYWYRFLIEYAALFS
jgi:hypothetical protein